MNGYAELIIVVAILLAFFFLGIREKKNRETKLRKAIAENYGKTDFEAREKKRRGGKISSLEEIKNGYFSHHTDGWSVDDITWKDLEMNRIFQRMNHCYSFAGEEVLYHTLRVPKKKEEEIQRLSGDVDFFVKNADTRKELQYQISLMGKGHGRSIFATAEMDHADAISLSVILIHYLLLAVSVVLLFVYTGLGVLGILFALVFSVVSYFKERSKVMEHYLMIQNVMILVRAGKRILPELKQVKQQGVCMEACDRIEKSMKELNSFSSGAGMVLGIEGMGAGAFSGILLYFNMIFHVDLLVYRKLIRQLQKRKMEIDQLFNGIGYLDSCMAIGSFRTSLKSVCSPDFSTGRDYARGIYHPLIENPVKNDYDMEKCLLITGSNASGKSTFLRTVAINLLFAQTIGFACAEELHMNPGTVYSSMALEDNLLNGESYFMVEIKAMKRILEASQNTDSKVYCFVDEVLRGTNTVERIAASSQVLAELARTGVRCVAATHDIELATILKEYYNNYHFDEEIVGNDVKFNYRIKMGQATTKNAIALLKMMGYKDSIVEQAREQAEQFTSTGVWKECR